MVMRGRPKINIDLNLVEQLATIQCTQEEIAQVLGVSVRTLQRNKEFCQLYKKGQDEGRASLRRYQWKAAAGGDRTMLVWLGKQYLSQSDATTTKHTGDIGITIVDDVKSKMRE